MIENCVRDMKSKKHLYESVNIGTRMTFAACGIPCCDIDVPEHIWQYFFADSKRKITCKNCKRTKLFRG